MHMPRRAWRIKLAWHLNACMSVPACVCVSPWIKPPLHSCIWAEATGDEKQGSGLFEMVLCLNSPRTVTYKPTNQPVINNVLKPFIQGIMFLNTLPVQWKQSRVPLAKWWLYWGKWFYIRQWNCNIDNDGALFCAVLLCTVWFCSTIPFVITVHLDNSSLFAVYTSQITPGHLLSEKINYNKLKSVR